MTTAVADQTAAGVILAKLEFECASSYQEAIMAAKERFILISGGGRSGKSYIVIKKFWIRYFEDMAAHPNDGSGKRGSDPMRYWLIGESYGETEKEFAYLSDDLIEIYGEGVVKPSKRVDPGEIVVQMPDQDAPHMIIETKSAQDVRKMSKDGPHGIIMCEAGQQDFIVLERAQERLTEKFGWLMLPGTMEGSIGWFPSLIGQWASGVGGRKSYRMPTYSNKFLFPGGRQDPKILELERISSDDFFMERVEGLPVPPRGLVFPEFRPDVHIQRVERTIGEPVYVWVDPGYSGSYYAVVLANIISGQVRIFGEIYEKGMITEQIIEHCMNQDWWKEDLFGVIDVAARSHNYRAPVVDVWINHKGAGLYMKTNRVLIPEGIERVKSFLRIDDISHQPRLIIDPRCSGIISEFGAGPNPDDDKLRAYTWGTDRNGNVVGKVPEDKYNDAIKAMTYGLIDRFGFTHSTKRRKIIVRRH